MKALVEHIIRIRNPKFTFDNRITFLVLIELTLEKIMAMIRSLKLGPKAVSSKLFIGRGCKFFNRANMSIGHWVKLGDFVKLSALGTGTLEIGSNVGIGDYSNIIISTSFNKMGKYIKIGNNVGIGEFAYLGGGGGLQIGDDCIIGQYFSCHPENHHFSNPKLPIREQGVSRKGIKIGSNCWIGSKVTILDGVTIGNNCVVAAGAVVTKSFPSNSIIGGVPAKVIGKVNE